jgi:hypothetical protein
MSKEAFKVIIFWVAWLLVGLLGITVTTVVVYLFLEVTGLHDLGQMGLFQFGLAMVECGIFGLVGSKISEQIHEKYDLETLDRLEIFSEPE